MHLASPWHKRPTHERFEGQLDRIRRVPQGAFSLIELMIVVSIVGLLLALATPSLLTLGPNRKTAIHELAGQLALARAEALTKQRPVYVAFATDALASEESPFRSYALYSDTDGGLSQISPWHRLPEGIVFALGEHFETSDGIVLRTILDLDPLDPEDMAIEDRREFPIRIPGVVAKTAVLPYLRFGALGEVEYPYPYSKISKALHVGIAEGFYDGDPPDLKPTGTRPALNGTGTFPQGEILAINSLTGQTRILSD